MNYNSFTEFKTKFLQTSVSHQQTHWKYRENFWTTVSHGTREWEMTDVDGLRYATVIF
jgi:predicted SprT family Zn-dependent metalloprotease